MSQYTLAHRVFPFDPYAIPHDFAVRASSALLQHEMPILLEIVQFREGDTLEKRQQSVHEDNLKQISDLMQALEWLKNTKIYDEEDLLLDVKLWYTTDHVGGFSWSIEGMVNGSIEGMVNAHSAHSHPFEIGCTDDWHDEIGIFVNEVCIKSFKDEEDEEGL